MKHTTISVGGLQLDVYVFVYEPVASNMYFIPIGETGIVFDPNINEKLPLLLEHLGIKQVQIILTHEHYDHTTGVEWLQSIIPAPVFCHKDCAHYISSEKGNTPRLVAMALKTKDMADGGHRCEEFMAQFKPYILKADRTFIGAEKINVDTVSIDCYSTPGHSPGSACYIIDGKYIFTGDSLIQESPTITRFKTSNNETFEKVTRPFLRSLDKNMLVFPGHGEPFIIKDAKYL